MSPNKTAIPPRRLHRLGIMLLVALLTIAGTLAPCSTVAADSQVHRNADVAVGGVTQTTDRLDGEAPPNMLDYGDAPDHGGTPAVGSYNTCATNDGPSHTGDAATVACWIDFNRNGLFGDVAGEHTSTTVGDESMTTVTFSGFSAVGGITYSRCRIARNGADVAVPTGLADSGEVEDSLVAIAEIQLAVQLSYFPAEPQGEMVGFTWETATETANAGFELLAMVDGEAVAVTEQMIPSSVIDSVTPTPTPIPPTPTNTVTPTPLPPTPTATPADNTPPLCEIIAVNPGPPISIDVRTQDPGSGLAAINVLVANNATVTIPPFTPGTNGDVIVHADKINPTQSSQVTIEVIDVAGNITICDPVTIPVVRQNGKPVTQVVTGLPDGDNVYVMNNTPGLKNVDIVVNGTKYKVTGLGDDEMRTIGISASLTHGVVNVFEVTAKGKPGTSAAVTIPVVPVE